MFSPIELRFTAASYGMSGRERAAIQRGIGSSVRAASDRFKLLPEICRRCRSDFA